jgi:hypothetical protein
MPQQARTPARGLHICPPRITSIVTFILVAPALVLAQSPYSPYFGQVDNFAGTGTQGFGGDGGAALSAQLGQTRGVAADRAGNVYICEDTNQRIRRVDAATGVITTVAGNGTAGFSGDSGPATSAKLNSPRQIAVDSVRNWLYIADLGNNRVRRVNLATGTITTVAGGGSGGDGGLATSALVGSAQGVAVDATGNVFISEPGAFRVRRVDAATQIISTVAGNGTQGTGGDGGLATPLKTAPSTQLLCRFA